MVTMKWRWWVNPGGEWWGWKLDGLKPKKLTIDVSNRSDWERFRKCFCRADRLVLVFSVIGDEMRHNAER